MNAAELIVRLVNLEQAAGQLGDFVIRDFIIEAQDWILHAQKENLELLRENHWLRNRHEASRQERVQPAAGHGAAPPLIFHAVAQINSHPDQAAADETGSQPELELAPAV
jgi:hypothetical protein